MNEKDPPHVRLMRSSQLEDALGLPKNALAKMRLDGSSPKFIRLGRRIYYDVREVQRWLDANTFTTTAEASAAAKGT